MFHNSNHKTRDVVNTMVSIAVSRTVGIDVVTELNVTFIISNGISFSLSLFANSHHSAWLALHLAISAP